MANEFVSREAVAPMEISSIVEKVITAEGIVYGQDGAVAAKAIGMFKASPIKQ